MGVILDTSILVAVERGALAAADVQRVTRDEPVYIAPPVIVELKYGVHRAKTPAQKLKRSAALAKVKSKPCLVIDRGTGEMFGQITAALDGRGKPTSFRTQDLWLAALAVQHRLKVMTLNVKDFSGIPGLTVLTVGRSG